MLASLGSAFYVLFGYPLGVIVVSRLVGKGDSSQGRTLDRLPSVTVLVAAYNEERVIGERIENLLNQEYPRDRLSILVVADGSDDATAEIARSFGGDRVRVLADGPRKGKSAALSRALPLVESEITVFSDANNSYEPEGIRRLVGRFSDAGVGAVTGAKKVRPSRDRVGQGESLYWRYESLIKSAESSFGSCVAVVGEMLAVRTALVGSIPENTINDDFYIAMQVLRAGSNVAYEPAAVSWEPPSASISDDRARRQRIVAGRIQALLTARQTLPWSRPAIAWQVISHKLARPFIPLFAAIGFVSSVMALREAVRDRRGLILPSASLIGQVWLYGAARLGRRSDDPGRFAKLAAYLVDSNSASVAGVVGYLRGRQGVIWEKAARTEAGS
jgi:cellulose synthase/poly-beta-1,6-N-acetylglucosamine synthase-like glycosyltransferase